MFPGVPLDLANTAPLHPRRFTFLPPFLSPFPPPCGAPSSRSPWVCNCDHAWANHAQRVVEVDLNAPPSSASLLPAGEFQVRACFRLGLDWSLDPGAWGLSLGQQGRAMP